MKLIAKLLPVEADKPIAVMNKEDADELGIKPLERVEIRSGRNKIVAILNVAEKIIKEGEIGLYEDVLEILNVKSLDTVSVEPSSPPESIDYIKKKMSGATLSKKEIDMIVKDTVCNNLSDIEITSFVTSLYNHGITMNETAYLSMAMKNTGQTLDLGKKKIFDKHSIGGVPGDKTSILVVPIVAAAGLTIPKTSSRAITSPAGTADRFECIAPVELDIDEIKRVVKKTNGCLVWGGAVDLAPADDIFIKIEYPLSIDPFLLPSVMSKKKAVGAKYLVIDIPTGDEAKVNTMEDFENLAEKFITLGRKLKMEVNAVSTFADQPLGHAIGPALEAREALRTIMKGEGPPDLVDKVTTIAGTLLSFGKYRHGVKTALRLLRSGKAYRKLREIIEEQGGDPNIRPEDIPVGKKKVKFVSKKKGTIQWISNKDIDMIARSTGAPKHKGSGIVLHKKIGQNVKKGDVLFEIYAMKRNKLKKALEVAENLEIMKIGKRTSVTLERVPMKRKRKEYFILER